MVNKLIVAKCLNIGCSPLIVSTAALAFLAACQPKMDEIDPRCFDPYLGLVFVDEYGGKFATPIDPPECPPEIIPVAPVVGEANGSETPPNGPETPPNGPDEKESVSFARPGYSGGSDRVSGNTSAEVNQPSIDAVLSGTGAVGDTFSRPGG